MSNLYYDSDTTTHEQDDELVLVQFGVKGMRWGVRRAEANWSKNAYSVKTYTKVYNKTADRVNEDLPRFNKGWEGKDLKDKKVWKAYISEYKKTFEKIANEELTKALGGSVSSPTGRRVKAIMNEETGWMAIVPDDDRVKHADDPVEAEDVSGLGVQLYFDDLGFITKAVFEDSSGVEHQMLSDDILHFGVKGMRWGVRKSDVASGAKKFFTGDPKTSLLHPEGRANTSRELSEASALVTKAFKSDSFQSFLAGGSKASKEFFTGNPKTSVLHPEGRAATSRELSETSAKVASGAKKFFTGDPKTSLVTKQGRESFKTDLQNASEKIKKVADSEAVKYLIRGDPKTSLATKQGRDNFRSDLRNAQQGIEKVARSKLVKEFLTGYPETSLLHSGGRLNARQELNDNYQSVVGSLQKVSGFLRKPLKHTSDDGSHFDSAADGYDEYVLEHFGVKGMRWGVRRDDTSGGSGGAKSDGPDVKKMSDAELQTAIKRLNLERDYIRLTSEDSGKKSLSAGRQAANEILATQGKKLIGQYVLAGMKAGVTLSLGLAANEVVRAKTGVGVPRSEILKKAVGATN